MYDFEIVVIGAGALGLAIARDLSQRQREVLLVEKEASFGTGISSRNSEVIHAGMYYKPGSLKAKHCVEGRRRIYDYCRRHNIEFRKIGKLIVATDRSQVTTLGKIQNRSRKNGLVADDKLVLLSQTQIQKIAPDLFCLEALFSPETGILNSHTFMKSLAWDAEQHGTTLAFNTTIEKIDFGKNIVLMGKSAGAIFKIKAKYCIVAAGLHTTTLCTNSNLPTPSSYWLKGNYFSLLGKSPFKNLIYPVPETGGLGIHLTIDLQGRAKFGPDTENVSEENYTVNPLRAVEFERRIRKYWPSLPKNSLVPAYSGMRPKINCTKSVEPDFEIYSPKKLGVDRLFVLHGIESPGLTSCLSLANEVANELEKVG